MEKPKDEIPRKIEVIKALHADIKKAENINVLAGYQTTMSKIRKRERKEFFIRTFNRTAAVIAIPLLISTSVLLYFLINNENKLTTTYAEVSASPGAIIKTTLPDGSEVWLNSESTLRYPSKFAPGKREVELTGEAFFDIKTNPDQPFEVTASSGFKVIAKGTAFNVSAYVTDAIHEIVLQEGVISVVHNNKTINLTPYEMISLNKQQNTLLKSTASIYEKTGWKEGLLIFRNTPLDEVLKKISRRYNVDITMDKETDIDYRIRATFSNETVTQILDILKLAAPISWEIAEAEQNNDLTYSRQQIHIQVK